MEQNKDSEKAKRSNFDEIIKQKFGDSIALPKTLPRVEQSDELAFDPRDDDKAEPIGWLDGDPVNINGTPVFENSLSDILKNAEVLLPQGVLNTIMYDVEFSDRATKEYAANTIAESLYSTVDSNGHSRAVLESILDHTKDDRAIDKADKY